jgi:Holliday junction resolvasome RuvABC endonuclease subunit
MKLLAFDQASLCGYSIIEDGYLIDYNVKDFTNIENWDKRVSTIKQYIDYLVNTTNCEIFILEDIQMQKNKRTFKELSELLGVLKNYFIEKDYLYIMMSPSEWRKELKIKGRKRAEQKASAQKYVKDNFGVTATEDESDAVCIGIAAYKKYNKYFKKES